MTRPESQAGPGSEQPGVAAGHGGQGRASERFGSAEMPERRVPGPEFFRELVRSFRRHSPQGSHRWNFGEAFGRLERVLGRGPASQALLGTEDAARSADGRGGRERDVDAGKANGATPVEASDLPAGASTRARVRARAEARLRPLVEGISLDAVHRAIDEDLGRRFEKIYEGLDATLESLRFLAARIHDLEDAHRRRLHATIDLPWLVAMPDLRRWQEPVLSVLREALPEVTHDDSAGSTRPVVHAECGDGAFTGALLDVGLMMRGVEPRGALAWEAAGRGIEVHVGEALEGVQAEALGSLAGVVLSGVVDRAPLDELLELLEVSFARLARGGVLIVIGSGPGTWPPVARDLMPGGPLHPETWELLMRRAGLEVVARVAPVDDGETSVETDGTATYCVAGRRP